MASNDALLWKFNTLASGLQPPHSPTVCPGCFAIHTTLVKPDNTTTILLQTKCHAFCNALMLFVTADWTASKRASAAQMLRRAHLRCRKCNPSRKTLEQAGIKGDVWNFTFKVVDEYLSAFLDARIGRLEKGFGSKRGRWPTSSEQLFPGGPERTMAALVNLLEVDDCAMSVIVDLVMAHSPLAFSVLLTREHRTRIIDLAISRTTAAFESAQADLAKIRQPVLAPVRDAIAQRHIASCHRYILLLYTLCFGPDHKMLDKVHFLYHREAGLFAALEPLVRLLEHPERSHQHMTYLTGYLWHASPLVQLENLGYTDCPPYAREMEAQSNEMLKDPYRALHHYLTQQAVRRECQGPDCGKRVHDKSAPGAFSRCGKCRAVQYCSRECQKADWTDERFPHKEICDMLRELYVFSSLEMVGAQFAEACRAHSFPLKRVDQLIAWATNGLELYDYEHGAPLLHRSMEPGMTINELYGISSVASENMVMLKVFPNNSSRRTPLTQAEIAMALTGHGHGDAWNRARAPALYAPSVSGRKEHRHLPSHSRSLLAFRALFATTSAANAAQSSPMQPLAFTRVCGRRSEVSLGSISRLLSARSGRPGLVSRASTLPSRP